MITNSQLQAQGGSDGVIEEYEHAEQHHQQVLKVEPSVNLLVEPIERGIDAIELIVQIAEYRVSSRSCVSVVPVHAFNSNSRGLGLGRPLLWEVTARTIPAPSRRSRAASDGCDFFNGHRGCYCDSFGWVAIVHRLADRTFKTI